jgi:lauroyl/myristoyl acyltransferase
MTGSLYRLAVGITSVVGAWFMSVVARIVCGGYFALSRKRVAVSLRFYRAVFPEKGLFSLLWLVWRQFQHFGTIHVDRIRLGKEEKLHCEIEGLGHFRRCCTGGRGGIFLMSHFGNWEIAAHAFRGQGMPLMVYMAEREGEKVERGQKEDLSAEGILVLSATDRERSPMDLLEALRFLRSGGFVSIAGDRVQGNGGRLTEGEMFGHRVLIPVAPHVLAVKSGVPMFALFPIRLGSGHYRIHVSAPLMDGSEGKEETGSLLKRSVGSYLKQLEGMVRRYPEHWYHFEPFLGEKVGEG